MIKQGWRNFTVRSINLLFLFGIKRKCLSSGSSLSQCLSIRRAIKQTVAITAANYLWQLHKIVSNILLSRLAPYAEKIIEDHQCGFRRNRSNTDHIFYIRQIHEKKWEYSEEVY
jgi:hypothetical protein